MILKLMTLNSQQSTKTCHVYNWLLFSLLTNNIMNIFSTKNLLVNLDKVTFDKSVVFYYSFEQGVIEKEIYTFTKNSQHGSWLVKYVFNWFQKNMKSKLFITITEKTFSFYKDDVREVLELLDSLAIEEQ
jgi:hypothetical protein